MTVHILLLFSYSDIKIYKLPVSHQPSDSFRFHNTQRFDNGDPEDAVTDAPSVPWAYRYSVSMSADPTWSRLSRSAFL